MTIIENRELSTLKRKKKSNIFHIKVLLIEQRNIKRKFMKKKFQWSFWLQCCCLFLVVNFVYYCKIYSIYFEYKYVISILPGGQPIKKSYFSLKIMGDNSILHFHEHIAHAFLDIWPHFLSSPLFLVLKVIPFLVTLLPFFECTLDYLYGVCNYTIK